MLRFGEEIVERRETRNDGRQRRRNLRFRHVGDVAFAVHFKVMDLRMEGLAHLAGRAAEKYERAPFTDFVNGESLRLQPARDRGNVMVGRPKVFAELFRRHPVVKQGRLGIVLPVDHGFQHDFLFRAALQQQHNLFQFHGVVHPPGIVLRTRQRVQIAL